MKENQRSHEERIRAEKPNSQDRDFSVVELNAILNEVSRATVHFLEALEFKVQPDLHKTLAEHELQLHELMADVFQSIIYGNDGREILPSTPAKLHERCVAAEDQFPAMCEKYGIRVGTGRTAEIFTDAFRETYAQVVSARPAHAINRPPVLTHFKQ